MMEYLELPNDQTFVAVNVDGAAGYIGCQQAFNSANDGYTLLAHNPMDVVSYTLGGTDVYKRQPQDTINWTVTSSPGGGSDIYTRMISDIMTKNELINGQTVVVTNKTDGSGEVGRNEVANTKGKKANYTLLTFNSGDLMPMVQNTKNRAANFKIVAIMAVDKQLIFKGEKTTYNDFAEAIEAAKNRCV